MLKNNQRNITEVPTSHPGKGKRRSRVIVLNALLCLFSLSGIISGTTAWFSSNKTVEVTGSSFTVSTPDDLVFDLYYLDTFTVSGNTKNGNYNPEINRFAGYEANSYLAPSANFTKINYDQNEQVIEEVGKGNPTNITKLWPAHRLTYVIVTEENVSSFSLTDWTEQNSTNSKTNANTYVSMAWAINMYGASYSVTKTSSITDDIKTAYSSYKAAQLTDKFFYSETTNPVPPSDKPAIEIVPQVVAQQQNKRTLIFFTLEFSNDPSTFYSLNETTGYYYQDSNHGNSNCYENLLLTGMVFKLA